MFYLTGPSAHRFATLAFDYQPPPGRTTQPLPRLEVRQPMPVPVVGDIIVLPGDQGGMGRFRVTGRQYRYDGDRGCTITFSVTDAV